VELLRAGLEKYGRDWVKISSLIPGRTREQVKNKGIALPPDSMAGQRIITGKWRPSEVESLRSGIDKYGHDWVKISGLIPGRTREQVKNKVRSTVFRSHKHEPDPRQSTNSSFALASLARSRRASAS
jgi:hypothetical protein